SGNKGKGGYQNSNGRDNQDTTSNGNQKQIGNDGRGGYNGNQRSGRGRRGGMKKFDKRNIKCYNCQKYGHFADECRSKDESNDVEAKNGQK
ncbi:retrovirus-related Pol polyprotein from transposon TNT 1-94, partial [Trifolium medium]|nr:retrovirus-related Pol polyprotein from transposon TNT 1-94 [Trifolium medium]